MDYILENNSWCISSILCNLSKTSQSFKKTERSAFSDIPIFGKYSFKRSRIECYSIQMNEQGGMGKQMERCLPIWPIVSFCRFRISQIRGLFMRFSWSLLLEINCYKCASILTKCYNFQQNQAMSKNKGQYLHFLPLVQTQNNLPCSPHPKELYILSLRYYKHHLLLRMRSKQQAKLQKVVPPPPQPILETRQEKIHYFLQKVEEKIVEQIDTSSVKFPKQKIPFIEIKKDQTEVIASKLKKMQINKELMQSRLESITQEQQELKWQHRQLERLNNIEGRTAGRERSVSPQGLRPKSELSKEDISILKKLKKEHQQFEKNLEEKTKIHEEMMMKMKRQQEQLEEKRRLEEGQMRRKEITKRLQALNKQKSQREKQFQEQKRKLIEIKAKKKLFEQCQKAQKEKQKAEIEKKVALMESRIKQRELDLQSIKQHQQKYKEMKALQRANRQRKKEQFIDNIKQRKEDTAFQRSKYYTIVLEESKKRKQQQLQKQRQKFDLLQAAKIYAEEVKRDHSPRVKTKSSQSSQDKKPQKLSFEEIKDIGNNYFIQMKKLLKKRDNANKSQLSKDSVNTTSVIKVDINPSSKTETKYRDYLSQRRMIRPKQVEKMSQTEDRIKDRFIRRDLEDVYKIMSSKQDRGEKLQRVKTIAQKLEVRDKGDDHNMIDKISAKLKILESLTQQH